MRYGKHKIRKKGQVCPKCKYESYYLNKSFDEWYCTRCGYVKKVK